MTFKIINIHHHICSWLRLVFVLLGFLSLNHLQTLAFYSVSPRPTTCNIVHINSATPTTKTESRSIFFTGSQKNIPRRRCSLERNTPQPLNLSRRSDADAEIQKEKTLENGSQKQEIVFSATTTPVRSSNGVKVAAVGMLLLLSVSAMTSMGFLLAPDESYPSVILVRDISVTVLAVILATILVQIVSLAKTNGYLLGRDSRKVLHTLSAPLFIVFWPLYSNVTAARYFAAIVPLLNVIKLILSSREVEDDEKSLARLVSRSGDKKEALDGPLVYVIILLLEILCFWRSSPVGIISLSVMAGGDGAADLIGRRFGGDNKWFFNPEKSVAGTVAFFVCSLLTSVALLSWMRFMNVLVLDIEGLDLIKRLGVICGLSALVELIPLGDDNWNVPIFASVAASFFLYH